MPDLEQVAKQHADTLNKSITSGLKDLAQNLLIGLIFIGTVLFLKK